MSVKFCTRCSTYKPTEDFNKWSRGRDGLQTACRSCTDQDNQRNHPISKIAFSLVGGSRTFYSLARKKRLILRENARVIHEVRRDASALYNKADEIFDTRHKSGFVYAVTNPAFDGWVKIGMTTDPARRLNDYQTSDPLRRYEMPAYRFFEDRRAAELEIHEEMALFGRQENEWFEVPLGLVTSRLA